VENIRSYQKTIKGKEYLITEEYRQYESFGYRSRFGNSSKEIKCPFCFRVVTAYIWSLYGCGKRCDCGAIHSSWATYKEIKRELIK
jgi:hypothetical protein